MAKHGLYDETPKMERDDEGHLGVKKSKKEEHPDGKGKKESVASDLDVHSRHSHERREMKHRHTKEHMDMHHKHETEHSHHKGHKSEVHSRHHSELKEMHGRHESEHKSMHTKHEKEAGATGGSTVGEPIAMIEKGAK